MRRPLAYFLLPLALILLIGAFGWLVTSRRLKSEIAIVRAARELELTQSRSEDGLFAQRRRAPVLDSNITSASTEPVAGQRRLRDIANLYRSGLLGMQLWPDPIRNSLSAAIDDIAAFLGLSETETTSLRQVAEAGTQEFVEALRSHAVIQREGSLVTIVVADTPEVRAAYDRMLTAIKTTLGTDRYKSYESVGGLDVLDRLFDRWGRQGTEIKVAHASAPPPALFPPGSSPVHRGDPTGRLSYFYTHSTAAQRTIMSSRSGNAQPPPESIGASILGTETLEDLRLNLGPLANLVPSDL